LIVRCSAITHTCIKHCTKCLKPFQDFKNLLTLLNIVFIEISAGIA